jgi:peptidoglycan/LPS O-acetylase OafA/YrhL
MGNASGIRWSILQAVFHSSPTRAAHLLTLIPQRLRLALTPNIVRDKGEAKEFSPPEKSPEKSKPAHTRIFTQDLRHHPAYRPDIDGLRALAIIPVVIFHAFPTLLPGGFIGVDIFFVISGFLISSIIFKSLQRESFTFSGFYANRIKRIFPALLLVLAVCSVLGWLFLLPGEYAQLGKHIFGGAAYIENIILQGESGYFDTKTYVKPLMHLWSLGIEEQFYLTYPLLLWLVWRLRRNPLIILLPLIFISFCLNLWQVRGNAPTAFLLPQTRFWELWAGGILAYFDIFKPNVLHRPTENWPRNSPGLAPRISAVEPHHTSAASVNNVLSTMGALLVVAGLLLVHESAFPGWWALLPVCGAALLISAGPTAWINRTILSNPVAVFIGLISYPLYLWHWPILSFGRILRGGELSSGARIAAVILSLILSWATWRFVESQIRFGRKIWIKTAGLAVTSVIVGAVGYTIHYEDGFSRRFKSLPADFGWASAEPYATPDCRKKIGSDTIAYCRSLESGDPDVLLIGDSHAASLYHGLAPAYAQRSQTLMNLGEPGCVPFYDTETYALGMRKESNCPATVDRMLDFATSTPSVRIIIISLRGPMNMLGTDFGEDANGRPEEISWHGAPQNSSQAEMFAGAFRNTVQHLSAAGKNVILLIDWPELGFDPRSCLPRPVPLFSQVRPLCGVPRAQVEARNRAYRELIFQMKKDFPGLGVFDPLPYLCDPSACHAMNGGHLLYRDDNHLSAAGAVYLSEKFLAEQPLAVPSEPHPAN